MTKIDDLEFRMHKMTTAENRSQDPPYKPQVAPQCRGGDLKIEVVSKFWSRSILQKWR